MHKIVKFFSLIVLPLLFLSLPVQAAGLSDYRLGSGDRIKLQVYGEEEMTVETLLSDAGTISYPFLGELRILGMTVGQLESKVISGLKPDYFVEPQVTVTILEYRQFFINGEVEKPGGYAFQPGLSIRKAVSLAGGFTERASKKLVMVISDGDGDKEEREEKLNSPVAPGDIITVEQSFF
jgi:protein involved in polysaccharide export with SLBB domain|tara:strand:+ start:38 stop:577 length:540 start_codon:yes stop_codon:yes gene_type:complete